MVTVEYSNFYGGEEYLSLSSSVILNWGFGNFNSDPMFLEREQMEELMQEMDPEKMQEQLNEMELNHDAMEKELDRALEQFRQLEWETKME